MPILFTCQCGKQLKVRDELAGERVKCPKCGKPTVAPIPEAEDKDDEVSQSAEPESPGPPVWTKALIAFDLVMVAVFSAVVLTIGFMGQSLINSGAPQRDFTHGFKEYLALSAIWFIVAILADVLVLKGSRIGFVLAAVSLLLTLINQGARADLLFDGSDSVVSKIYPEALLPLLNMNDGKFLLFIVYIAVCVIYDIVFLWAAFKVGWKRYS